MNKKRKKIPVETWDPEIDESLRCALIKITQPDFSKFIRFLQKKEV